jgi:hypothetical protein
MKTNNNDELNQNNTFYSACTHCGGNIDEKSKLDHYYSLNPHKRASEHLIDFRHRNPDNLEQFNMLVNEMTEKLHNASSFEEGLKEAIAHKYKNEIKNFDKECFVLIQFLEHYYVELTKNIECTLDECAQKFRFALSLACEVSDSVELLCQLYGTD